MVFRLRHMEIEQAAFVGAIVYMCASMSHG